MVAYTEQQHANRQVGHTAQGVLLLSLFLFAATTNKKKNGTWIIDVSIIYVRSCYAVTYYATMNKRKNGHSPSL
jgi:Na+-driven multidrug efflux pump